MLVTHRVQKRNRFGQNEVELNLDYFTFKQQKLKNVKFIFLCSLN